jgi:excisionase family DNA binding protein
VAKRVRVTTTVAAEDRIGPVMRALARVRVLCEARTGGMQTREARALMIVADAVTELVSEMAAVRAYAEEMGRHRSMPEPPSGDRLLTVKEAAEAVNCHPETLRRAYRLRHLKVQGVGRLIRIHPKELSRWCQSGSKTS